MIDPFDELAEALHEVVPQEMREETARVPAGERPCPICGQKMEVEPHGPVEVDICRRHGIWLDNGELTKILLQAGNRRGSLIRRRMKKARRDGKMSGMLFDVWSLFWD